MHNTFVYYYAQLPERLQRDVYLPILNALQTHREKCAVPFILPNDMELVMDALLIEQPIIAFYQSYRYRTFNDLIFSIEFDYLLNENQQNTVTSEIIDQANRIAIYAGSVSDNPLIKVKAVYEYFCTRIVYDGELHSYAFNSAGSLIYGSAVCMGIAIGFKLVLDILAIPSVCVRGEHDGGAHAWSMVYLDGKWLPFDVTVGVCQTGKNDICYDGFGTLPYPEKYKPWAAFSLPNLKKEDF